MGEKVQITSEDDDHFMKLSNQYSVTEYITLEISLVTIDPQSQFVELSQLSHIWVCESQLI